MESVITLSVFSQKTVGKVAVIVFLKRWLPHPGKDMDCLFYFKVLQYIY